MTDVIDFGVYKNIKWTDLSTEYLHGLADMGNKQAQKQLEFIYELPIETQKIGFGKFAGKIWVELDRDYLYWILNNVDSSNIKFTLAKKALKYIEKYNNVDDNFEDVIYVD